MLEFILNTNLFSASPLQPSPITRIARRCAAPLLALMGLALISLPAQAQYGSSTSYGSGNPNINAAPINRPAFTPPPAPSFTPPAISQQPSFTPPAFTAPSQSSFNTQPSFTGSGFSGQNFSAPSLSTPSFSTPSFTASGSTAPRFDEEVEIFAFSSPDNRLSHTTSQSLKLAPDESLRATQCPTVVHNPEGHPVLGCYHVVREVRQPAPIAYTTYYRVIRPIIYVHYPVTLYPVSYARPCCRPVRRCCR